MAGKANFSVIKGDTFNKNVTFTSKTTGNAVDLTGSTISGKIKKGASETSLSCALVTAAQGKFKFGLNSAQTGALEAGTYGLEVKITYPDTTVQTLITGNLVVKEAL